MSANILIVDDSQTVRSVLTKTIKISGLPVNHIYQASNGKEALDVLQEEWIDIVLADINMPLMNGVEMIEKMSEDGLMNTIPVIIISSDGSMTRIHQLKSRGVRAYIRKPFTPEIIRSVIMDVLGIDADGRDPIKVMSVVFCDVMEKQAYMFADPVEKEAISEPDKNVFRVRVGFRGDTSGHLTALLSESLSREIASSVLGTNGSSNSVMKQWNDAIKELLCMTCSHMLTELKGDMAVFDILPDTEYDIIESDEWRKCLNSKNAAAFIIDAEPLVLSYQNEKEIA